MSFVRKFAALALFGAVAATASLGAAQPKGGPVPVAVANPQPTALQPGLAVTYFHGLINHIREMQDAPGKPGAPLPSLNYNVGYKNVLSSDREDGVQARILGFIKLDKPGIWKFAINSNDGVRLEIGGKKLYELPGVQPDVMSDVLEVKADAAGWYPLKIMYFEKRNTSTLELYWAAPGVADLAIVPPEAFGHVAAQLTQ